VADAENWRDLKTHHGRPRYN